MSINRAYIKSKQANKHRTVITHIGRERLKTESCGDGWGNHPKIVITVIMYITTDSCH